MAFIGIYLSDSEPPVAYLAVHGENEACVKAALAASAKERAHRVFEWTADLVTSGAPVLDWLIKGGIPWKEGRQALKRIVTVVGDKSTTLLRV